MYLATGNMEFNYRGNIVVVGELTALIYIHDRFPDTRFGYCALERNK
jgi:hypothetical protein